MRWVLLVVGVLLVLSGATFALQGVGILPSSLMHGQTFWAVTGTVILIVGIGLFLAGLRIRPGGSRL